MLLWVFQNLEAIPWSPIALRGRDVEKEEKWVSLPDAICRDFPRLYFLLFNHCIGGDSFVEDTENDYLRRK